MKIQSRKSSAQELVQTFVQDLQYRLDEGVTTAGLCRAEAKGFLRGLQLEGRVHEFAATLSAELDRVMLAVKFEPTGDFAYYSAAPAQAPVSVVAGSLWIRDGELQQFDGTSWQPVEAKW